MEEPKSKSQKKREADALQKFGLALLELRNDQINKLVLPDQLKQALIAAKKITSHGAVRRQAQLIGKLMRLINASELFEQYAKFQQVPRATLLKRFEHLDLQSPTEENLESQLTDDQSNI